MSGRLSVSAEALRLNFEHIRKQSGKTVAPVVKADAYGLGVRNIAPVLWDVGARTFFVATLVEGLRLRSLLPQAEILVLDGPALEQPGAAANSLDKFLEAELIPVLNSREQARVWPADLTCALHVDTGMKRLGLDVEAAVEISAGLGSVAILLTHYARADEPGHPSLADQSRVFSGCVDAIRQLHPELRVSASNSAAALTASGNPAGNIEEDIVRTGIALYGGNPFDARPNPMLPVCRLTGRVLQRVQVQAGEAVGYGGSYVAPESRVLATVGVGYADGVPRLLSNQGRVAIVAGEEILFAPIVGRVSMDLVHIDVTELESEVDVGTEVEFVGKHVGVDEVAAQAQTISYEVLTGLNAADRLETEMLETLLP